MCGVQVQQEVHKHEDRVKCEACGKALAADETLDEHVVSVHLTIEGLCNICGEDSEDFVDHFKIHLKCCKDDDDLATLDSIKKKRGLMLMITRISISAQGLTWL